AGSITGRPLTVLRAPPVARGRCGTVARSTERRLAGRVHELEAQGARGGVDAARVPASHGVVCEVEGPLREQEAVVVRGGVDAALLPEAMGLPAFALRYLGAAGQIQPPFA